MTSSSYAVTETSLNAWSSHNKAMCMFFKGNERPTDNVKN